MNIKIVICPACLKKYNAYQVLADGKSVQCPHCKYWCEFDKVVKFEDELTQYFIEQNKKEDR